MRTAPCVTRLLSSFALIVLLILSQSAQAQALPEPDLRNSVVKIHATSKLPSVFQPWRKHPPREGSGTGVIIDGNRILTNAHVVAYATQVYIQPYQSADRIEAKVVAYAPGVDLALIELPEDEQGFFKDRPALAFDDELPAIRGDVSAYGYPVGGEDLSVTKGIVSRIEVANYKHGFIGLRIQVDAALNPGNSGGPAIIDDKVVGIVFATRIAVSAGLGKLPEGISWTAVTGVALLAGIGFTVSLFITGLAFDDPAIQDNAKIGVLSASVLAAGLGSVVLRKAAAQVDTETPVEAVTEDEPALV